MQTLAPKPEPDGYGQAKVESETKKKPSQADELIKLAMASATLFLSDSKEGVAAYFITPERRIVKSIGFSPRGGFGIWLAHQYRMNTGQTVNSDALARALLALQGEAAASGQVVALQNRVAFLNGSIFYDLGDGFAVKVDAGQWSVISGADVPIIFRAQQHQEVQAHPVHGGEHRRLFSHFRVRESDRILLLCWLVSAFIPMIPRPVLTLSGEKGAGKSLQVRKLRKLIDPSITETLCLTNDANELVSQADHHYCLSFDNLGMLKNWQSDALCRFCTGEGSEKRTLYTDDDSVIRRFKRIVILNGISCAAVRADLLDRSIIFDLPRIEASQRQDEARLWAEFEADRACLLGAIFDLLAEAMRLRPEVKLKSLPRMADFTLWACAIAKAAAGDAGQAEFITAYKVNMSSANAEAAAGNPIITAMQKIAHGEDYRQTFTAAELLRELNHVAGDIGIEDTRTQPGWPKSANTLTRRLKEVLSNLQDMNIYVSIGEHGEAGRLITVTHKQAKTSSAPSGPSESP